MKEEAKLYLRSDLSNHCACTPVNYGPYPFFLACVYTQAADALESSGEKRKIMPMTLQRSVSREK